MHIVVIEKDRQEYQFAAKGLKRAFPQARITLFESVGEFLLRSGEIGEFDILIVEHSLPLTLGGKEEDAQYREIVTRFPNISGEWSDDAADEFVIRYIRKANPGTPVVIYTYGCKEWISDRILEDPQVKFCEKDTTVRNLNKIIRSFDKAA